MEHIKTIHLIPITGEFQTLTYRTDRHKKADFRNVIMSYITMDEEAKLDNNESITIIRKDIEGNEFQFIIEPKSIYSYGIVDLNFDSDDADLVDRFKFLSNLDFGGYPIPTFNYKHSELLGSWYSTWSPLIVCQYAHCKLGKPERIVIFRNDNRIKRLHR